MCVLRRHEVSRAHKTTTMRAVTKNERKEDNRTSACKRTRARQARHKIWTDSPFCVILKKKTTCIDIYCNACLKHFNSSIDQNQRNERTYCSSARSLSYAQAHRHLPHTITAMGIWASPSRLTYAAENSRNHHQILDIHTKCLASENA